MKKTLNFDIAYILLAITAVLITGLSILFKAEPLRILPLYISLYIMILNSRINRYGPLIGGFNSILYAIVYFKLHLYGNAFYALFFSFPLQVVTFILWSRRKYKHSIVLKTLSTKARIIIVSGVIALWILFYSVLSAVGSSNILLDNTATMLGILSSILCMLSYSEYTYLSIPNFILGFAIQVALILQGDYAQLTYLVYQLFSGFCTIRAIFVARNLLKEQQK